MASEGKNFFLTLDSDCLVSSTHCLKFLRVICSM